MIKYRNLYSLGEELNDGGVKGIGDINRFKRVDRTGFNATDSIDTRFFKILFYFYNEPVDNTSCDWFNGGSSGLLAPTWLDNPELENGGDYYKYNSAWAFLKNNFEEERADALKTFINLLSNISMNSPWYFQKISGVDEALARENWKVGDERKKISIECLADPVDHRIESLLSLYRSIIWSHTRKCEILPANLRKFDMGLFVFSGLINKLHKGDIAAAGNGTGYAQTGTLGGTNALWNLQRDRAACKYIEFHNCEISRDSIKSGFRDLTNDTGIEQTFTIDIYFDDCYENEYNPFLLKTFGDMFLWDVWTSSRGGDGAVNSDIDEEGIANIISTETSEYINAESDMGELLASPTPKKINVQVNPSQEESPLSQLKKATIQSINNVKDSVIDSAINAVTGDLGNIYGQGVGIAGTIDAVTMELGKQWESLKNKVTGNINGAITDASRSLTSAATAPVLGSIKATGIVASSIADAGQNMIVKPVLGTTKMIENTSKRITELGYSYVNEAGQYVVNESNRLGTIAYNTQANLPNTIGAERLNPPVLGSITKEDQKDIETSIDDSNGYVDEHGNYIYKESNNLGSISEDRTNQQLSPNLVGKNRLNAKLGNLNK